MRDTDLYGRILGIESPWEVSSVELRPEAGEVEVFVVRRRDEALSCPECGCAGRRHDARRRSWRHLPTCQYRTILTAAVPRVRCSEHGVRTVAVPWSDPGSRFTALFESLVIDWLGEASISAVARQLDLSWDQVSGVLDRAVDRGLARRGDAPASRCLGVDETSFQKRHEYVTVVADLEGEPRVHHVADGRGKEALSSYYESLSEEELSKIEAVAMDMWPSYISATVAALPDGDRKIAFDKFHVAGASGRRSGQGAPGGAPDAARAGRPSAGQDAAPVAVSPGSCARPLPAPLQGADRRCVPDGALLAPEGSGNDDVGDAGSRPGPGDL